MEWLPRTCSPLMGSMGLRLSQWPFLRGKGAGGGHNLGAVDLGPFRFKRSV